MDRLPPVRAWLGHHQSIHQLPLHAMAASALFILDLKGRVILSRDYRGDVAPKLVERFISRVNELEDTGNAAN